MSAHRVRQLRNVAAIVSSSVISTVLIAGSLPASPAVADGGLGTLPTISSTATTLTTGSTTALEGAPVLLRAQITPSNLAGTVVFSYNGSGFIGMTSAVNGVATLSTSRLPTGTLDLTAQFVPVDFIHYGTSKSPVRRVTITPKVATVTTTVLTTKGTKVLGKPLALTAHVKPATAAGMYVRFKDAHKVIGSVPVINGTAILSVLNLTKGKHQLTAVFVPLDTRNFTKSSSAAVPVKITLKRVFPKKAKVGKPKGKAKVGKKLTVTKSGWPSGTTFAFQWRANGKVIKKKGKARTFKITKAQRGKTITVAVTATKAGYKKVTKVSPKTVKVKKKGA